MKRKQNKEERERVKQQQYNKAKLRATSTKRKEIMQSEMNSHSTGNSTGDERLADAEKLVSWRFDTIIWSHCWGSERSLDFALERKESKRYNRNPNGIEKLLLYMRARPHNVSSVTSKLKSFIFQFFWWQFRQAKNNPMLYCHIAFRCFLVWDETISHLVRIQISHLHLFFTL